MKNPSKDTFLGAAAVCVVGGAAAIIWHALLPKLDWRIGDLATWAGAIGSAGAAIAAVWIALRQTRDRRQSAEANFDLLCREGLEILTWIEIDAAANKGSAMTFHDRELEELIEFGRRLDFANLTSQDAWIGFLILKVANGIRARLAAHPHPHNYTTAQWEVRARRDELSSAIETRSRPDWRR